MIKSQDYLKGTSARGYVSWRNGDPCRICWPVPQTRENTTLTTMMLVIVVRLASGTYSATQLAQSKALCMERGRRGGQPG